MAGHAPFFTDLVDSTAAVEQLGDARAADVLAEHDRRARALLARHGGREIDLSDGFFLLFESAPRAAAFALAYHAAPEGFSSSAISVRSSTSRAGSRRPARMTTKRWRCIARSAYAATRRPSSPGSASCRCSKAGWTKHAPCSPNAKTHLRAIDEKLQLVSLLCLCGRLDLATDEPRRAFSSLDEAVGGAEALRLNPASPLWKDIATLREAIAVAGPTAR